MNRQKIPLKDGMAAYMDMTVRQVRWADFFNPVDNEAFANTSDVTWFQGDWLYPKDEINVVRNGQGWIVANRHTAEYVVRHESHAAVRLMGALMSWRTVPLSQLRGGLCAVPLPEFERDVPNLYGAMCRLGLIDVGFSKTEMMTGKRYPEVWLALGQDNKLVRRIRDYIDADSGGNDRWLLDMLLSGHGFRTRRHARHNTFAGHVGLSALYDVPGVRFVAGDGWGSFRRIDEQAAVDAGMLNGLNATDAVLSLSSNNVLAGIEIQSVENPVNLSDKVMRWASFLSHSPMGRRGLVCVWLAIPAATTGNYASLDRIFEKLASEPVMTVGEPGVGSRIGLASWNDWYDTDGLPSEGWGSFTDMFGKHHSLLDGGWSQWTPNHVGSVDAVTSWGWDAERGMLGRVWGLDASRWRLDPHDRGGFYGFSVPDDVKGRGVHA